MVELYSDRVEYFITMNEPQCFIGLGYNGSDKAPSRNFRKQIKNDGGCLKMHM